jgi:hypothetical protein
MTTIAWDGKILAGDTCITGCSFNRIGTKLFQIGDSKYFGACGEREECLAAVEWLAGRMKEEPKISDSFAGILVENGKAYRVESLLIKDEIKEKHHAVGSGAQGAIVLMYMGFDAIQAIQTVSMFDTYTNSLVDHFTCS